MSKLQKNKGDYQKRCVGPKHDVRLDPSEQAPMFRMKGHLNILLSLRDTSGDSMEMTFYL